MTGIPWTDPQFWIVTAVAATAGGVLLRTFLPSSRKADEGCAGCPSKPRHDEKKGDGLVQIGGRLEG